MAGNGPAPAENRRRQNRDTYADVRTRLVVDEELRGPELRGGPDARSKWRPKTRDWWESWRRSPQACAFLESDWERLYMLAHLVDQYFARPHHLIMAEIRLNESLLGGTHVDRLKARMKVESAQPEGTPAQVTALDAYRDRLPG